MRFRNKTVFKTNKRMSTKQIKRDTKLRRSSHFGTIFSVEFPVEQQNWERRGCIYVYVFILFSFQYSSITTDNLKLSFISAYI